MVAFNEGFNFRATLGFVTDPPDTQPLYGSGDSYPRTSGGVTYGRESGTVAQYRDRNASIDPRLAGIHAANDGNQVTYRVDLVQTGLHEIRGAFGDASFGAGDVLVEFIDGTTVFATIDKPGESISAGQWYDATGVVRSPASDWVANNEPIQHEFATQIFRVRIARPSGPGGQTKIAHLQVEFVGGGGTDATATPSGVSATGSVGTVQVNFDATVTLTGVAGTGAVGTATVALDSTAAVEGVSATGAVGSVTVNIGGDATATPAGVSATGAVGDVAVVVDGGAAVTGVSATGAVGTVTVTGAGDAVVPLTGIAAEGQVGTVAVAFDMVLAVAGVAAAGQVGAVTVKLFQWEQVADATETWTEEGAANDVWTPVPKAGGSWS